MDVELWASNFEHEDDRPSIYSYGMMQGTQSHYRKRGGQDMRRRQAEVPDLVQPCKWMEEQCGQTQYSVGHMGRLEKKKGFVMDPSISFETILK